jgi:hypothetical protein
VKKHSKTKDDATSGLSVISIPININITITTINGMWKMCGIWVLHSLRWRPNAKCTDLRTKTLFFFMLKNNFLQKWFIIFCNKPHNTVQVFILQPFVKEVRTIFWNRKLLAYCLWLRSSLADLHDFSSDPNKIFQIVRIRILYYFNFVKNLKKIFILKKDL